MTQEELLKRIKNVDYLTITKMSYEVIAQLTQDFKSLMVKELLKRGQTNEQQRAIIKAIKRSYKEWFKNENGVWSDFPGVFKYPKFLEDLQVDIECGFMITDEKEADDFEKRIADYMERHTMTKEDIDDAIFEAESKAMTEEDIDEAISEAESNTDERSEKIAALEERIKELESEIEKLKSENKELKEQQPPADNHDEIEELKEEIAYLKNETGKLSSREAAILTITACYHAGGLPSNRENLYPILTTLFGVKDSLAKRRLREAIKEEGAEALAKCFDGVSPVIARTLREMPEKLKNKKKK